MFYYIEGEVALLDKNLAVIDAGGVGFAVNTTANTLSRLRVGERARLYTYLNVGENALDLYGCPVKTIASEQGPALGAAILAGVGAGIYSSVAEGCKAAVHAGEIQKPKAENSAAYEPFYQIYRNLYPTLRDSFHSLAAL